MFDGVHVLECVVQDTRRVNSLEAKHLVVEMSDVQTLCGESIGLHLDVGS